jgi:hypothetical protein
LLTDGTVLVVGGYSGPSAEIFDPVTGTFSPTGSLTTTRFYHTATVLADGWQRAWDLSPKDCTGAVTDAINDYSGARSAITDAGMLSDQELTDALAALPERVELPAPPSMPRL